MGRIENKSEEYKEHLVPFGDKTLCIVIMEDITLVPGTIKDIEDYAGFEGDVSDYNLIPTNKRKNARNAVEEYLDEHFKDDQPALNAIKKNIQFWS